MDATYHIESELGSGGGGVVYKAWHTRLQKYVVIKELKHASEIDIETQRNEVEALKNVKSAYLPQVYDFITETVKDAAGREVRNPDGSVAKRIYTVMEFIEGESFDRLLKRGQKFTQQQVVKWYGQLALALEEIHKKNICHRDIKPANIMLMPGGDVCLIDFNAALVGGNDVRLISRSLGYASPEQYAIYERFRDSEAAPMHLGGSSVNLAAGGEGWPAPGLMEGVDWERSDIYSLGATMYHLLTAKHPPERAGELVPVSRLGNYSEGLVLVIERSMQQNPAKRFSSASQLAAAIENIHKLDKRWKASQFKKIMASILLPLSFALFAVLTLLGWNMMQQEKEESFYAALYEIENGSSPQASYEEAVSIFRNRIDLYCAMAERLWNDGALDSCRTFIESNLGNIAKFQNDPDAAKGFGELYFLLGNCYYYAPGTVDYEAARGNFEIAVQFVKDDPVYYRDLAIACARTGDAAQAGRNLEKAQVLKLPEDSLHLLEGEIAFAKQSYEEAAAAFQKVIASAEGISSESAYLRYRAYHALDEIYKALGQPEQSIQILEGAMDRIPAGRVSEMTERLAAAYIQAGDYAHAIDALEQLAEGGVPQFHILQDLAVLLQNVGRFDRAAEVLADMAGYFPEDYRVPMRQAFLEADRQSGMANESRDYALVKQYYDQAEQLYAANARPGESDPEMQQLEDIIAQLRANKWIE